jgi:hypothetical protein
MTDEQREKLYTAWATTYYNGSPAVYNVYDKWYDFMEITGLPFSGKNEQSNNNLANRKPFVRGHRHKVFNAEQIAEIRAASVAGKSTRAIAAEYRVSHTTIENALKP